MTKSNYLLSFLIACLLGAMNISLLEKEREVNPFINKFSEKSPSNNTACTDEFCAHKQIQDKLWQEQPNKFHQHQLFEQQLLQHLKKGKNGPEKMADYTLPVVVHIIHDNGAENISDATVQEGVQHLNDAFANVGYYDPSTGVDTRIEFCLARRDPDGNATTGITRDVSPLTEMVLEDDDITVKDLNRWDPTSYINIWLVREICSNAAGCGVAGYAYFPTSHGGPEDGIMMEANWFGSTPGNSTVIAHELGHYLGVYHTFEGGCVNNDCLVDGDRVCDTPPDQSTAAVPCNGTMNSCDTDANSGFTTDENDMFWNYMDYGDWNCYSAFTQGQVDRMHFTVENTRASLLNSLACLDPCGSPLMAEFSPSVNVLDVGGTVNFLNVSVNATTAIWEIDGILFSNNINADYSFNQVGLFEICLTVGNTDPNCFDETCLDIEVTCPVEPEFMTDNFYPMPGEMVNYTNLSQNANIYEWQIDGVPQSNNLNYSTSFPAAGIYDVCLIAGNGLCEKEFCLPVFVSETPPVPGECDTSFLKTFGTPNLPEFGQSIIAAPNGGFFIAGGRGDEAMITLLDASGDIVWTRQFNPTFDADDFIWKIKLDSEDDLIGIGQTAPIGINIEVYAFKYDWQNNQMVWLNELDIADPAGEGYYEILEKAPGDNYYIFGQTTPVGSDQSSALLMEVQRNTGLNVFAKTFNLNGTNPDGRFLSAAIYDNSIYVTGYIGSGPVALDNWRVPSISRFDLNGNQLWTRLYLHGPDPFGGSAALVPANLEEDNGMVVFGAGDDSNIPAQNARPFLFRTNGNGELEWAKYYDVPGSPAETASRMLNLPDGYLCMGNFQAQNGSDDAYIFKTNKFGEIQWSKKFGANSATEFGYDLIWQNGLVYLTGQTDQTGSEDVLLASLNPDGSATAADTCNLLEDLIINETDWQGPYDDQHDLMEVNLLANFFTNSETTQTVFMQQQIICANPCPEDSCDFKPDAIFQNALSFCDGDSMLVELTVCNGGNFELPENTPVSFYDGDPINFSSNLWHVVSLPQKIQRDSCFIFSTKIPALPNVEVYVIINDDGSNTTPFSLVNDFPTTNTEECDYTNNIGSFEINFMPPPLNLGPDILMCENGTVELDAGPGFFSYRWQDGSMEQTYTVFFPGTYSVEVTDSCGGKQTDEITILVDPASIVDLGNDTLICEGDTLLISLNGFDHYQWLPKNIINCDTCSTINISPEPDSLVEIIVIASTDLGCYSLDTIEIGTTKPVTTYDTLFFCPGDTVFLFGEQVTEPGDYIGVFPRQEGCDSTHIISLEAIANLFLVLPEDAEIKLGDSIRLNPITNGNNLIWQWVPSVGLSCDDCEHPYARPLETINYTLIVTDENGCQASDEMLLSIILDRGLYIPNAFSPNGDGVNDLFYIFAGANVSSIKKFQIFDRWGELVFEDFDFLPNDPTHGWNGVFKNKIMNPAVFVYKVEVEYVDGAVEVFYGDVTLLR